MPPLICHSLVTTINDVIKIETDIRAYVLPHGIEFLGNWAGFYRKYVEDCCSPNKSFSVQDQQNAGCAGSDTVTVCMDKAIKYCIRQSMPYYITDFKKALFNSIQEADRLSNDTKKLHDNLKKLDAMMP